jgi:uncharacterized protein
LWSWENGRFFRSVILIWNVAGRNSFWHNRCKTVLEKVLLYSNIYLYHYLFKTHTVDVIGRVTLSNKLTIIFASWSNVAFMLVLVSEFILLYQRSLLISI